MKFNKKWLWLVVPILIFSLVCLNSSSVSTVLLAIQGAITDGNLVKFSGINGIGVDTGLSASNVTKNRFDATIAPTVNNDIDEGYTAGSRWLDTTNLKSYVCLDNTKGEAVWIENIVEGDMNKSTYDTDEDGIVDKSETVDDGAGNSSTAVDVKNAVTKKHSQNTDTDLDATFEATFVKKADSVNVLNDITSTGAIIEDAVTRTHTQNTDTQFDFYNALASDHTWSGDKDTQPVGEAVVFGDLLYPDWTAGEWLKADADLAAKMPGLRIALESKTDGQTCLMLVKGYIRDDDAFEFTGAMVYASVTPGAMSSTAPSVADQQLQRVGVAKSADILFFDPSIDVGEIKL